MIKQLINYAVLGILLNWGSPAAAQEDSAFVLSFEKYIEIVERHHPLSMQANLLLDQGSRSVGMARGAFDPKLQADLANKEFKGKTYYDNFEGGLKVPTWFGLEFYSAFEQNQGIFLNPENNVPDGGLAVAGVSMPIGRGLFIDKRRAEFRKAQIYQQSTVAERNVAYNELFYEAGKSYWDWFKAYHILKVYQEGLALAEVRRDAVKQGALLGDRAFIDTLEAEIQVQNRNLQVQDALLDFQNAQVKLELFLWRDGIIPLDLEPGTVPLPTEDAPAELPDAEYRAQVDSLVYLHPQLATTRFKLEQLGIDQRLKRENLKPKLDVKYNFLTEPVGNSWISNFNTNNYTWGFSFSMPLFMRKERNSLALTKLKIESMQFNLSQKQESLATKVRVALNKQRTTFQQGDLSANQVVRYRQLLDGERRMFEGGESSLFLVNSRESSYISSQIKYLEILSKNRKAGLETAYTLGLLLPRIN